MTCRDFWCHNTRWSFWELWIWFRWSQGHRLVRLCFQSVFWQNCWSQKLNNRINNTLLFSGLACTGWCVVFVTNVGQSIFSFGTGAPLNSWITWNLRKMLAALLLLLVLCNFLLTSGVIPRSSSKNWTLDMMRGVALSSIVFLMGTF